MSRARHKRIQKRRKAAAKWWPPRGGPWISPVRTITAEQFRAEEEMLKTEMLAFIARQHLGWTD